MTLHKNIEMIGPYELLEALGRGGMGVVYEARHRKTGDVVALKIIEVADEMQLDCIRHEIRALARLNHPGIVRIVAEGVEDSLLWYAMEFVEALTLRHYFSPPAIDGPPSQNGRIDEGLAQVDWWTNHVGMKSKTLRTVRNVRLNQTDAPSLESSSNGPPLMLSGLRNGEIPPVLTLVRKLCIPLAFLHGEGIVHRDLKPENIMVREDGTPLLVDFGLMTRFCAEESREMLTIKQNRTGTVNYRSPEQIRGRFVDGRSDLYALGCILYELLVGHTPFTGIYREQVLQAHLHGIPKPPSHFRPEIQPELDNLVLRLLSKDPGERVGHADAVATALADLSGYTITVKGPPSKTCLYRSRLAGRSSDMALLRTYATRLQKGRGNIVLIAGKSGVGKTRLVMEVGQEISKQNIKVITGECSEKAGSPLGVFQKTLRAISQRCRERGEEETDKLLGRRGKILAIYESSLAHLPGQKKYTEPAEFAPEKAKIRLFSYLSKTLREFSREKPLMLILDDLHWVDELSLEYFKFVLRSRKLSQFPVLVVGTIRTEELSERLQKIVASADIRTIDLFRLDQEAVSTIVSDMLAIRPAPQFFCNYLNRYSEGNPVFVAEYVRTAVDEKLLWRDSHGIWQVAVEESEVLSEAIYETLPLPSSLEGLVERRLAGLSPTARLLINSTAVIGTEVNLLLLREITGIGNEELTDTVENLVCRQILERPEHGIVRFCHNKLRDVTLVCLEKDEEERIHRQIAKGIELLFAGQREEYLIDLGIHWAAAGEPDKARICYLAAARKSKNSYAFHQAEHLYHAHLKLVSNDTQENLTVRIELGDLYRQMNQFDSALREYSTVFERTVDEKTKALCCRAKAIILQSQGDIAGAIETYRLALELSGLFPLEKARTFIDRAYLESHILSNNEKAEEFLKEALELIVSPYPTLHNFFEKPSDGFQLTGIPRDVCQILSEIVSNLGLLFFYRSELDRALDFFQKQWSICEEINDRKGIGKATNNIGLVYQYCGELDRALEYFHKSLDYREDIGDTLGLGVVLSNIGTAYHDRGELNLAIRYYQKQLKISREIGDSRGEGISTCNIGLVYLDRGNLDNASDCFQKYRIYCEGVDFIGGLGVAHCNIGLVYQYRGDLGRAVQYFMNYQSNCRQISDIFGEAEAMLHLSDTYRLMGDPIQALKLNSQAMEIFAAADYQLKVGDCWCFRAECDIDREDFSTAQVSLEKARRIYDHHRGGEYSWRIPLITIRLSLAERMANEEKQTNNNALQIIEQAKCLVEEGHKIHRYHFTIEAALLLGKALTMEEMTAEALNSFNKALTLAHNNGYGLFEQQIQREIDKIH